MCMVILRVKWQQIFMLGFIMVLVVVVPVDFFVTVSVS